MLAKIASSRVSSAELLAASKKLCLRTRGSRQKDCFAGDLLKSFNQAMEKALRCHQPAGAMRGKMVWVDWKICNGTQNGGDDGGEGDEGMKRTGGKGEGREGEGIRSMTRK